MRWQPAGKPGPEPWTVEAPIKLFVFDKAPEQTAVLIARSHHVPQVLL